MFKRDSDKDMRKVSGFAETCESGAILAQNITSQAVKWRGHALGSVGSHEKSKGIFWRQRKFKPASHDLRRIVSSQVLGLALISLFYDGIRFAESLRSFTIIGFLN